MSEDHDLQFELDYWGDCTNTWDEEQKHFTYAHYMGIPVEHYSLNAKGKKILDIGGGPVSMLLKCKNLSEGSTVLDPLMNQFPAWVGERYWSKGLTTIEAKGEDIPDWDERFDEVWIYNVLQHTEDPQLVIQNAKRLAPNLRIFEWVDIPPHEGHPHEIKATLLDRRIGGGTKGRVVSLEENGCYGKAYHNFLRHV